MWGDLGLILVLPRGKVSHLVLLFMWVYCCVLPGHRSKVLHTVGHHLGPRLRSALHPGLLIPVSSSRLLEVDRYGGNVLLAISAHLGLLDCQHNVPGTLRPYVRGDSCAPGYAHQVTTCFFPLDCKRGRVQGLAQAKQVLNTQCWTSNMYTNMHVFMIVYVICMSYIYNMNMHLMQLDGC